MNCPNCSAELQQFLPACPNCGATLPSEPCTLGHHVGKDECEVCHRPLPLRSFVEEPNAAARPDVLARMFQGPPVYPRELFRQYHQNVYLRNKQIGDIVLAYDSVLDAAEVNDHEEALRRASAVLRVLPYHAETLLTIAHCHRELGNPRECIEVCNLIERYERDVPDINFFRCHSYYALEDFENAIEFGQREIMTGGVTPTTDNIPAVLALAYYEKIQKGDTPTDDPLSGEFGHLNWCYAICLSRSYEMGHDPGVGKALHGLLHFFRRRNADETGTKMRALAVQPPPSLQTHPCGVCGGPFFIEEVKSGSHQMILQALADAPALAAAGHGSFICMACVRHKGFQLERIGRDQFRFWHDGQKFISYGKVFFPH